MRARPAGLRALIPALLALLCLSGLPARAADAGDMYQDAIKLYEKGDYDKALKGFLKVMRLDPSNAEAREYMLRCSQKIVETKLGGQAAESVEKEIDADKAAQQVAPDAPPALSEDYLKPIKPSEAPQPAAAAPAPEAAEPVPASLTEDIKNAAAASPSNARDLLSERSALTDDLRRRFLGTDRVVDVDESGSRLGVTFYMNRLFLPLSDALRPESYAVLDDVADLVRANPKRNVTFTSVDNVSPAVRNTAADLPARRTSVVFSYLLYTSYAGGQPAGENQPTPR